MQLVQTGDRQAYEVLFQRYREPIWRYLVKWTRDAEAASELYQETFLRVWRSADTWKPGRTFKPWLYRIAKNLARDRHRYDQREVETVEVDLERARGVRLRQPVQAVDLERALAALPDHYREAFLLGAVEGLDHREMAEALDISPVNARARVSRARAKLRELLAEPGEA